MSRTQLLMGNIPVTIQLETSPTGRQRALLAMESSFALAKYWEERWSEWLPQSEISCLNQNAGRKPCQVAPKTLSLLQRAMKISMNSQGAFDIRFGSATLAGRMGLIEINEKESQVWLKHPHTRIGLGGIAKGSIVDLMADHLKRQGYQKFLINAGGDLLARGGPWPVALAIPDAHSKKMTPIPPLTDQALATSGNAERGVHIKDPHTGKGIQLKGSVTVIAESLELADAWATAAWVLGPKNCQVTPETSDKALQGIWLSKGGKTISCPIHSKHTR